MVLEWLKSHTIDNPYIFRVNWSSNITALYICSQQENVTWRDSPHELSKSCRQIDPPSLYFRSAFTRTDGQRLSIRRGVESVVSSPKERETPGVPRWGIKASDAIRARARARAHTHTHTHTHSHTHTHTHTHPHTHTHTHTHTQIHIYSARLASL